MYPHCFSHLEPPTVRGISAMAAKREDNQEQNARLALLLFHGRALKQGSSESTHNIFFIVIVVLRNKTVYIYENS